MDKTQFCFISDQYYIDFPDAHLMKSKETVAGSLHGRPFFLAFNDLKTDSVYWLIPVSSKYDKYKNIYDKKIEKYGFCDTIHFGTVLGVEAAFLIQNICPATERYIGKAYLDKNRMPIRIDNRIANDVIRNARRVVDKHMRGTRLIFPDVKKIYDILHAETASRGKDS